MTTRDEHQIRDLVRTWMTATRTGDIQAVLDLMTDDVVFMTVGQEPFGKAAFRKSVEEAMSGAAPVRYEGESDIEEIRILGDWAYARTRLKVTTVPSDGGSPLTRSGYTLSIFRKERDGRWRLARDANLLSAIG